MDLCHLPRTTPPSAVDSENMSDVVYGYQITDFIITEGSIDERRTATDAAPNSERRMWIEKELWLFESMINLVQFFT